MKVIFICASVDVNNAIIGDTLDRALTIASHPQVSSLRILSLHSSEMPVVKGLSIHGVGTDRKGRISALVSFFRTLNEMIEEEKPDLFYLYMCPTLAPLLFFYRVFKKIYVVQWFGHSIYTFPTKTALKYFSDLWFNSNKSMAPFRPQHLHLVGQGVKPDHFFYDKNITKKFDMITVGRVTPVKKIDQMIEVLKLCRDRYGKKYTLNVCGDSFVHSDDLYKRHLLSLIEKYQLSDQIFFSGMVPRAKLPTAINEARLFLFLVNGGVGKAILEGIACGVPVVVSTPEADDFFGNELSSWFLCEKDTESVCQAIMKILDASPEKYRELSEKANRLFSEKYTMERFIDRIVTQIAHFLSSKNAGHS
jgi:glycosyltransferase involved in cell wall biosynthesis